jgi:hypothetical protein
MVAGSVISAGNPPAFELLEDGTLNARRANISGNIYANSGQLNNVVINENCQIKGTLNVGQIKGNILSAKNYVRDAYLSFGFNPPLNFTNIMAVEGNGCWQTLCFAGTTGVECKNGNVSEVTLQFLFNNQFSFNINKLINNGKINNLCLPVHPFPAGSRVNILLIGERNKYSKMTQCIVSFNSLALLMNNSNGFLD